MKQYLPWQPWAVQQKIEKILSILLYHQRWPRQEQWWLSIFCHRHYRTKLCQCKCSLCLSLISKCIFMISMGSSHPPTQKELFVEVVKMPIWQNDLAPLRNAIVKILILYGTWTVEQLAFKNVNTHLKTNIYLETSGGQSFKSTYHVRYLSTLLYKWIQ